MTGAAGCGITAAGRRQSQRDPTASSLLPATLSLKPVARSTAGILGYVIVGDMIYLSGAGPQNAAGDFVLGKLGRDLDVYAPLLRSHRLLLPRSVPSIPAPSG